MDWSPFRIAGPCTPLPKTRAIHTVEGIGDRLRVAAFAELQAREAFYWAAAKFKDAPDGLCAAWKGLARAEQKHLDWLLRRMEELGVAVDERPVSDQLWHSFVKCRTAEEFSLYMAAAEERGRRAGERFRDAMAKVDPISATLFGRIAEEEVEHIALATRYFAFDPVTQASAGGPMA